MRSTWQGPGILGHFINVSDDCCYYFYEDDSDVRPVLSPQSPLSDSTNTNGESALGCWVKKSFTATLSIPECLHRQLAVPETDRGQCKGRKINS